MKKRYIIIIFSVMLLLLTSCTNSKPAGMSDNDYDMGIKILDTVDKYLDGDLNESEAHNKIDKLVQQIENTDNDTTTSLMSTTSNLIAFDILRVKSNSISILEIKEERDKLAKTLGQ